MRVEARRLSGRRTRRQWVIVATALGVALALSIARVYAQDSWEGEPDEAIDATEAEAAEPGAAKPPAAAPESVETIPVERLRAAPQEEPLPQDGPRKLEDIVVTPQKRAQSIQDVPISMSALNDTFIAEHGITDIREAMLLIPNVKIEEAGFFAAPRIRGFTFDNNNKAFEPPVGIVLDGIPYTRPEYFMSALFDIERIEVLRGPQGTAFGKNTTAGLIHLMSKDPGPDPEGAVQIQLGELNRRHIEAAYGGALTDDVEFRIAGLLDERDGFIDNTTGAIVAGAPKQSKDRQRAGVRAKLGFPDVFGTRLVVGYESVRMFSGGAAFEYVRTVPDFEQAVRRYDANADFVPGNWVASEDFGGFRDVQIDTARAEWKGSLGTGWDMVGLAAHSVMEQTLELDVDFTPAPATLGFGGDRSPTTTFELRGTSPTFDGLFGLGDWGSTDLLVGVFYEQRDILDSFFRFGINDTPLLELVAGASSGNTSSDAGDFAGLLDLFPGLEPTEIANKYEQLNQNFNQRATAIGGFSHVKWQFLDNWSLELGARYTTEKKDADWLLVFETPDPNPVLDRLGFVPFNARRERAEDNIQPKVSLGWSPWDDINLFAHWTRGFKGGGFNAFAYRGESEELEYEPEITTEWGADLKMRLFGGAARFNFSVYRMDAKDFQVLIRINPTGTIGLGVTGVENAPAARAQGFESDITWLAADWLTLIAGIGYNDTEYLEFRHNSCPSDMANQDGDGDNRCDATGKSFPYAPLWNGALTGVARWPLSDLPLVGGVFGRSGLELFLGSTVEYQTDSFLDVDLDTRKVQPEYYRVKANLGIGDPARRWSFRIIGENLNNAVTWIRSGDIFSGQFASSQNEPRLIFAQFRQDF